MSTMITIIRIGVTTMLEDFFVRALIAGSLLAIVTGPLGCLVVWRRMAYFGDTMAHSALLGVALSLLMEINLTLSVFLVAAVVAGALILLQRRQALSSDALLGILSHSALALGLVLVAFMSWIRVDLMGFLFGDILAVSMIDLGVIAGVGAVILGVVSVFWRPLVAATVNAELAEAEGMRPELTRVILMALLAVAIAIAMKIVGVLLITSLLIIPAATARRLSRSPEQMAVMASILGVLGVIGGLWGSMRYDTPSGPSIVVAALILFLLSLLVPQRLIRALG
jgi:zinc transport system permease protein